MKRLCCKWLCFTDKHGFGWQIWAIRISYDGAVLVADHNIWDGVRDVKVTHVASYNSGITH